MKMEEKGILHSPSLIASAYTPTMFIKKVKN